VVTSTPLVGLATGGGFEAHALVLGDGKVPVVEFLKHRRTRADLPEFYANLNKFLRFGFVDRGNAFKALRNFGNVWQVSATSNRMLGFRRGNVLILTNGFEKKRSDTEQKHVDVCEERKAAFLRDQGMAP
jgi:hypothetical protein